MSDNGPASNGMIGLAWGLGARLDQERFHGYVQAYIAQGYSLEQAQEYARQALGLPHPDVALRRRARGWAIFWGICTAVAVFCLVSIASAPATAGVSNGYGYGFFGFAAVASALSCVLCGVAARK